MLALSGCLTLGDSPAARPTPGARTTRTIPVRDHTPTPQGREVVMYALGLIGVDYRFGGQNPEAGLDCSGMVRYIYRQAARQEVRGSAADIARQGQRVASEELRPGDLVFFNTRNRPHSHVGIYIGEGRFIHAPSSNGKVRIDALNTRYYAERFEEGRTYF
jgi:cell wall-associated NlpC family hydrolase